MQEDKSKLERMDPEPQLIAEAITAYQHNNMYLKRIGLPIIRAKVIPWITIVGPTPTFYKIPITQDHSQGNDEEFSFLFKVRGY